MKKTQFNETSLQRTYFASLLTLRYIECPLKHKSPKHCILLHAVSILRVLFHTW